MSAYEDDAEAELAAAVIAEKFDAWCVEFGEETALIGIARWLTEYSHERKIFSAALRRAATELENVAHG